MYLRSLIRFAFQIYVQRIIAYEQLLQGYLFFESFEWGFV